MLFDSLKESNQDCGSDGNTRLAKQWKTEGVIGNPVWNHQTLILLLHLVLIVA